MASVRLENGRSTQVPGISRIADFQIFLDAQEPVHAPALAELEAGAKRRHWMWFVFPQIEGLGHSAMAQKFALKSRGEAAAYLAHPILGPRLIACTRAVNAIEGRTAHEIFASPDDLKFRSCMSLFALSADDNGEFEAALAKYFDAKPDPLTVARL